MSDGKEPRANRRRVGREVVHAGDPQRCSLDAFRERMQNVGAIVRDIVGGDSIDPSARVHDAYLVVISCIVDSLVSGPDKPTTHELSVFARALAEQRRLDLAELKIDRQFPDRSSIRSVDSVSIDGVDGLPKGFGRVVENIYGTTCARDDDDAAERSGAADASP